MTNVNEGQQCDDLEWEGEERCKQELRKPPRCKIELYGEIHGENTFYLGERVEILKLLQEEYAGKIKMIYIDAPPATTSAFQGALPSAPLPPELILDNFLDTLYVIFSLANNLLTVDGTLVVECWHKLFEKITRLSGLVMGEETDAERCLCKDTGRYWLLRYKSPELFSKRVEHGAFNYFGSIEALKAYMRLLTDEGDTIMNISIYKLTGVFAALEVGRKWINVQLNGAIEEGEPLHEYGHVSYGLYNMRCIADYIKQIKDRGGDAAIDSVKSRFSIYRCPEVNLQ